MNHTSTRRLRVATAYLALSASALILQTVEFMLVAIQEDFSLTAGATAALTQLAAGAALLVVFVAGTLLDRFSRQRAVLFSNLTRSATLISIALLIFQGRTGVELTALVLVAFGVNRLILAGLSAGLPLVAPTGSLIAANALAVTGGSVWVVLGGGARRLWHPDFTRHGPGQRRAGSR